MKKYISFLFFILLLLYNINNNEIFASNVDSVYVRETCVPILIDRIDNELFHIRIDATKSQMLDNVHLTLGSEVNLSEIAAIKLYYGGTECIQKKDAIRFFPVNYISAYTPGKTRMANPSYSILKSMQETITKKDIVFQVKQKLFSGINYFWISLQMKSKASLLSKFSATIKSISVDGQKAPLKYFNLQQFHLMGIGVRHAGDDNVAAYRIPGLATSKKGTLLAVYDVRHNSSVDLQEFVEIGLSRSEDGGQTWEKMRIPLSFGEYMGLPKAQNGVGDPAILVDEQTGTIWIMAAWTHGMGNGRAWTNSQQGMNVTHTAQLVLVKSDDDGKTWSQPLNITQQVKDPQWYFLLQGPGKGISTQAGTLVFAGQFIDSDRIPSACIIYSNDHGNTWHISQPARSNTTESQVIELEPGTLMLNMRDNRGGSRAVATTNNLGHTWQEHPSSRKALIEPVCMASLIHIPADQNILNKDVLLFSNPNTTQNRSHMTIKASMDKGLSWSTCNQLLLDEGNSWGYSCLTLIDKETIGILYESSTAHITFQAVKLVDIIKGE